MDKIYINIICVIIGILLGLFSDYLFRKEKIKNLYKKIDELSTETNDLKKQNSMIETELNELKTIKAVNENENNNLNSIISELKKDNNQLIEENKQLNTKIIQLEANKAAITENNIQLQKWIENSRNDLKDAFSSLSKDISQDNSKYFLDSANDKLNDFASKLKENLQGNNEKVSGIVKPVDSELKNLQEKMISLVQRMESLNSQNDELKKATELLNNTLKNNATRGKWGEQQLHKIAELSGMVEHIDYEQQQINNDGTRPDMTIHLSAGRTIPVDSKVPMNAYMNYLNATDEKERQKYLNEHVKALKNHIDTLNKKEYWKKNERSFELVAMVVPYESGLSTAFSTDQNIFSYAMEKNVLLLSPMTFFAFLKSVSIGWQETAMSKNAKKIAELSKEFIKRFNTFYEYFENIGKSLTNARSQYDSAVSSYNVRLKPTFNKIELLNYDISTDESTKMLPNREED